VSESPAADDPCQELVDLIDADDTVIGWARRQKIRSLNLLHRGVGIICYNSSDEIYVHRRTTTKDVFPGLYDMFVGGVVGRGESYDASAVREIAEELGIVGPAPRFLTKHLYIGPRNRSLVAIYDVEWNGPIAHQPEEVEWGTWIERRALERQIGPWEFVPDGLEIYRQLEDEKLLRGDGE
jgi:isopentenyldiphosphate isomerase